MRFGMFLLFLVFAGPAMADVEEDLEAERAQAMATPGAEVSEYPDFTMVVVAVDGGLTYFYFTKPGHYAHPASISRSFVRQADGSLSITYGTWPHSIDAAPASYRRWMAEFEENDEELIQYLNTISELEQELAAMREIGITFPGGEVTEYPDFTVVMLDEGMTYYYYTKPGHYAHPAAVRRYAVRANDGTWTINYDTWPYSISEAPPSYVRWVEEFEPLDEALFRELYGVE